MKTSPNTRYLAVILLINIIFMQIVFAENNNQNFSNKLLTTKTNITKNVFKVRQTTDDINVNQKQIKRGESSSVYFTFTKDCAITLANRLVEISNDTELKSRGITITPTIIKNEGTKCSFHANIEVTKLANLASFLIKLKIKDNATPSNEINKEINLEVIENSEGLPRGPIPPGLKPQVDIMWAVVPQRIVSDNFGSRVAKLFYCIEVVIGNNTGYDLQIASVGFKLGPIGKAATTMAQTYESVNNIQQAKSKTQQQTIQDKMVEIEKVL